MRREALSTYYELFYNRR